MVILNIYWNSGFISNNSIYMLNDGNFYIWDFEQIYSFPQIDSDGKIDEIYSSGNNKIIIARNQNFEVWIYDNINFYKSHILNDINYDDDDIGYNLYNLYKMIGDNLFIQEQSNHIAIYDIDQNVKIYYGKYNLDATINFIQNKYFIMMDNGNIEVINLYTSKTEYNISFSYKRFNYIDIRYDKILMLDYGRKHVKIIV